MATGVSRAGDEKNNTLIGGEGDDTLIGLAGNDRLEAFAGTDSVDAGPGNDCIVITDDGSSDTLIGGDGWDDIEIRIAGPTLTLSAPLKGIESLGLSPNGASSRTVTLLDGIFDSSDSSKNINTWNGASFRVDGSAVKAGHTLVFSGNQSNDTFVGGAGVDRIQYQLGSVSFSALQISGSSTSGWTLKNGDEELLKISGANSATGWAIQDLRKVPAKGSTLFGLDQVTGVERVDLYGQESNGNWYLIAYLDLPPLSSTEVLSLKGLANRGTDGNDSLVGSAADDQIYGLLGSDTIVGLAGNDNIVVADDGSTDQIDGGDGWDNLTIRVDSGPVVIGGSIRNIENVNLDPQGATTSRKVTILDAAFGAGQDRLGLNLWGGGVAIEMDGSGLSAGHRLESFNGNSGNDTLRGGSGNDYFWGNQGDDVLIGGAGEDKAGYQFGVAELGKLNVVELGANRWAIKNGSDSLLELNYHSGKAQWTASDVRKVIAQNSSAFGTDTLQTIEQIDLHAQDSQVRGYFAGYVKLTVSATGAASVKLGGTSDRGTDGNDSLVGSASDDQIYGLLGSDTILGLAGNDNIVVADDGSTDQIDGGDGWDNLTIRVDSGPVVIGGSIRNIENVNLDPQGATTSRKVTILDAAFGAGQDRLSLNLWGGGVAIEMDGSGLSAGHRLESFNGNSGNDTLRGGAGNDYLWGNQGDDLFVGGAGEDKAGYQFGVAELGKLNVVELGSNRWAIRNGSDSLLELNYHSGKAQWTASDVRKVIAQNSSAFGTDTLQTIEQIDLHAQDAQVRGYFAGYVRLTVSGTGAAAVTLGGAANRGTDGNDSLVGSAADDQIYGLLGSDTIVGLAGNDNIVVADNGSTDQIDGGDGWDTLTVSVNGGSFDFGAAIRNLESINFNPQGNSPDSRIRVLDSVFSADGHHYIRAGDGSEVTVDISSIKSGVTVFLNPNQTHTSFVGGASNSALLLPWLTGSAPKLSDFKIDVSIDGTSAVVTSPLRPDLRIDITGVRSIGSRWDDLHALSDYIDPLAMAQQGLVGTSAQRWNAAAAVGTAAKVSFSFVLSAPADGPGKQGFRTFTESERATVRDILSKTAAIAGLTFSEVTEGSGAVGQIRFGVSAQTSTKGVSYAPSVNDPSGAAGDVWMDVESMLQLTPGSEGYAALLHEVGHALGLRHPRNYDSTDHWAQQLRAVDDRTALTVMSESTSVDGEFRADWGLLDVAALRYLYGANANAPGDSRYLVGDKDALAQRSLVDDSGVDTLDASNSAVGVLLDLQPGHLSSVGVTKDGFSSQENLGLAVGTWVENAIGSRTDDVLIGNVLDNRLQGLSGNDWLDGREGIDTAVFSVSRDQVLISTAYGYVYVSGRDGASGFDTLVNVEQLEFSDLVVKLNSAGSGRDVEVEIDEDSSLEASLPDPTDQSRSGVSYAKVSGPTHGSLTLSAAGQFSFLPTGDFNGSDSFVFRIQDAGGSFNEYRYYINVAALNDLPTGALTIEGAASQSRLLKAVSSLADADGLGTLTYQWSANGAAIAGANSAQYLLGAGDVGKAFTVTATYTDLQGTLESVTTSATPKVLGINAAPVGTVVIAGAATQGQVLNATNSITDANGLGTISTRWQISSDGLTGWADVVNSGGVFNGPALTLEARHAGSYLRAAASYTDGLGLLETVFSDPTSRVGSLADAASRPTIAVNSNQASLKAGQTATLTFSLSESVTDFMIDDITVSGGTLSNFSGSGANYSVTFTPLKNSLAQSIISVASNRFSNRVGNFNVDGADVNNTVKIAVNTLPDPNVKPTAASATLVAQEDQALLFSASDFGFKDTNIGDSLQSVSITTLPSKGMLKLDGATVTKNQIISVADITAGKLAFTPAANASGTGYGKVGFKVSDGKILSAAAYTLTIDVTAANDAPIVAKAVTTPVSVTEGKAFSYTLPKETFKDVDVGDTLTYSATGLPNGITIDSKTGKLAGTVGYAAADNQTLSIAITATDKAGLSGAMPLGVTFTNSPKIAGTAGNDNLVAGVGADSISGVAGNDTLSGGGGNDTLVGGAGSDVLTGGADADRFVFDTALGATNVDTIKDFAPGTEKIVLSAKIFTKFKGSILSGSIALDNFVVGTGEAAKANDGNDYLIYDTATDLLYYDADGSGKVAAAVAFAKVELIGADAPAFGDFLVVS